MELLIHTMSNVCYQGLGFLISATYNATFHFPYQLDDSQQLKYINYSSSSATTSCRGNLILILLLLLLLLQLIWLYCVFLLVSWMMALHPLSQRVLDTHMLRVISS